MVPACLQSAKSQKMGPSFYDQMEKKNNNNKIKRRNFSFT